MTNELNSILITNLSLSEYAGSELNTLSIAQEFKKMGKEVTVATLDYEYPLKQMFEESNIHVVNLLNSELEEKHYDLIWSHHTPVLYDLMFKTKITCSKLIFCSLSSFEPLECPPAFYSELSLILSNSFETRDKLLNETKLSKDSIQVFPNFSTEDFFEIYNKEKQKSLNSIAIISSHPPQELRSLTELFIEKGFSPDLIGKDDKFQLVSPDFLKNYDLVITIGKTVQFCFASGIPVYCYDYFGGPGFINTTNIEKAAYFNFSGRGFNRQLGALELYSDIIDNYSQNINDLDFLREYCIRKFSLKTNLNHILNILSQRPEIDLDLIRASYRYLERKNDYFIREYKNKIYYLNRFKNRVQISRLFLDKGNGWSNESMLSHQAFVEGRFFKVRFNVSKEFPLERLLFNPIINKICRCKITKILTDAAEIYQIYTNALSKVNEYDEFLSAYPAYEYKGNLLDLSYIEFYGQLEVLNEYEIANLGESYVGKYLSCLNTLDKEKSIYQESLDNLNEVLKKLNTEKAQLKDDNFQLNTSISQLKLEIESLKVQNTLSSEEIRRITSTFSWKVTSPLRLIRKALRRISPYDK